MIIIKLKGGLGNQMFQYALGIHLAKLNNTELKLDLSDFDNNIHATNRKYSLDCFNISGKIVDKHEVRGIHQFNNSLIGKAISRIGINSNKQYIKQKDFSFDSDILKLRGACYLDGHWQSEKYFIGIKKIIKKDFTLKNDSNNIDNNILNKIKESNSVSLHVRRGDYISNNETNEYHGVCSLDYYDKCIKNLESKIDNPSFFVFSDDIEWCKKNLEINYSVIFVSNGVLRDYEEMILMSKCKHHIIANSSFSWWSAWLGEYSGKLVYASKKWFNKNVDIKDLIPDSWIKI